MSNELPKKLIVGLLSVVFLTFGTLAINTFLMGQMGVKTMTANILESFSVQSFDDALKNACSKQTGMTYSECEALALGQICPQYATDAQCSEIGEKGKNYFIKNIFVPNSISKINEMSIPKTNIRIGELDAIINNVFVLSVVLSLVSVILMVMVIAEPRGIVKILGTDLIFVGLPMVIIPYLASGEIISMVSQAGIGADPKVIDSLSVIVSSSLKPLFDVQQQVGIELTVIGLVMLAATKLLFKKEHGLLKK